MPTPLSLAVKYNRYDACVLLLTNGADMYYIDSNTSVGSVFDEAVDMNRIDICKAFLDHGYMPAVDGDAGYELYLAIRNSYTDLSRLLIEHGSSINGCRLWNQWHSYGNGRNENNNTLLDVLTDLIGQ